MKTVTVCTPGSLYTETITALNMFYDEDEIDVHLIHKNNPFAYEKILAKYWEKGEDFVVIEPDIVIRPDVVEAFLKCPCEYGCFPYPWLTDVGPALGCTWFRASFLQKYPDVFKEIREKNIMWNQLDVVLMRHILARKHGEQPHVHLPAVTHLNPNKQLMPGGNPEPLTEVPCW